MKEHLQFENERLAAKNSDQEVLIDKLQEKLQKDSRIYRLLIAATGVATAIAIQYLGQQREQEITTANNSRITELAHRLEHAEKKISQATSPLNPPPPAELKILTYGTHAEKVAYLSKHFDSQYLQNILSEKTTKEFATNNQAEIPRVVAVTGSHELLSAPEVVRYLKGYPDAWITGNIVKVTLHNEKFGRPLSYSSFGKTAGQFNRETKTIDIFGATITDKNLIKFDRVITHELAHSNDWINSDDLTVAERIDLLAKIYARTLSQDRYISTYVESVTGRDYATLISTRCEEYFATISEAYFNNPTELNYKDYQIIHDLVSKKNPTYDIEEGMRIRVSSFNSYRFL